MDRGLTDSDGTPIRLTTWGSSRISGFQEAFKPLPARFRYVETPDGPETSADRLEHRTPAAKAADSITIEAVITPPPIGDLRIIMQQRDSEGSVVRSVSNGKMGQLFAIRALQAGKELPVEIRYDAVIWSGLSWGVGEVRHDQIAPGKPIRIRLFAAESDPSFHLDGRVYKVEY